MDNSPAIHLPLLVNTLGHIFGLAAFSGFLYFLWRSRRRSLLGDIRLPGGAALLALLWNAGSLGVLAAADSPSLARRVMVAGSFATLSLLPSVLLHVSLGSRRSLLCWIGYGVGLLACGIHLAAIFGTGVASHQFGLRLITFGFGSLAVLAALALWQDQQQRKGAGMRMLGAMALFLFAVSFAHFGEAHGPDAWAHELLVHHAGIPLALVVLLQDYRFLLLDVFVRFLGNALLAVFFAVGLIGLLSRLELDPASPHGGFSLAVTITGVGLALLGFSAFRGHLEKWVERRVFRRGNLRAALQRLQALSGGAGNEEVFLRQAAEVAASFAKARRVELLEESEIAEAVVGEGLRPQILDRGQSSELGPRRWAEVAVPLRFAEGDRQVLLLSARLAGRRYLSEDLEDLNRLATEVVAQVARRRRAELQGLATRAELQALRAQINPHFLFNSLNALYGLIPRAADEARRTVVNLAEIFRYLLQGNRQQVPLEEELRTVRAYLEVERLRLGRRLATRIDVSRQALGVEIPALSIQPLVENAVKHGISRMAEGGSIGLEAEVEDGVLEVTVSDDGPGFQSSGPGESGQGLENVRRRLRLCYGEQGRLQVESTAGRTRVGFRVPLKQSAAVLAK
ncbi:MAG: histidine kinase [Acidobacteria bacterium]|nr:histidine kinase [Acidobacteriota bacterium]